MIEADRVQMLAGQVELVATPSGSGKGQKIARCPVCRVAVWSHYAGAGDAVCFVRVGTLDEPDRLPPDIHIFTATKQPWVVLPPGVPAVAEYYATSEYWPAESLARRAALLAAQGRAPRVMRRHAMSERVRSLERRSRACGNPAALSRRSRVAAQRSAHQRKTRPAGRVSRVTTGCARYLDAATM